MGTKVVGRIQLEGYKSSSNFFDPLQPFFSFLSTRDKDFFGISLEWCAEPSLSIVVILRHLASHSRSKFHGSLIYNKQKHTLFTGTCNTVQVQSNISFAKERTWQAVFLVQTRSNSCATGKPEGSTHFSATLLKADLDILVLFFPLLYTEDVCSMHVFPLVYLQVIL